MTMQNVIHSRCCFNCRFYNNGLGNIPPCNKCDDSLSMHEYEPSEESDN